MKIATMREKDRKARQMSMEDCCGAGTFVLPTRHIAMSGGVHIIHFADEPGGIAG